MRRSVIGYLLALPLVAFSAASLDAQTTWLMKAGTGDGSVSVTVDQYGGWDTFTYDPYGATGPSGNFMGFGNGYVYLRIGAAGPRAYLNGPASPLTGVPLLSCTGTFTQGPLSFKLDQSCSPLMVLPGPVQNGIILKQDYTITNTSAATVDFELVRYWHMHLGSWWAMGGGRKAGPPESFFLYDKNNEPTTLPVEVSVTGGGTAPPTNRYETMIYWSLEGAITSGSALADKIAGDLNADGLIDPGKEDHYEIGIRTTFSLAPGASVTSTTNTNIGGTVVTAGPSVNVIQSGAGTKAAEGGAGSTYNLVLNTVPTSNVTINVNSGPQLKVFPSAVVFTPANWNVQQTINVSAIDDSAIEGLHSGTISHSSTSLDAAYNGLAIASVPVQITDNDSGNVGEGNYPGSGGPASGGSEGSFGFGFGSGGILAEGTPRTPILHGPLPGNHGAWTAYNVAYTQARPADASNESTVTSWPLIGGLVIGLLALAALIAKGSLS